MDSRVFLAFLSRLDAKRSMNGTICPTTRDALAIWQAGVDAVRSDLVVEQQTSWDGRWLEIADHRWDLKNAKQIVIVGAGKASVGMLAGLLKGLNRSGKKLPRLTGWINVPQGTADDSNLIPSSLKHSITVCKARPHGRNEPTPLVVSGTQEILELVRDAGPDDCVVALISGGGSALLCAPIQGVSLYDKIQLTRALSANGANIEELNAVRRCLSQVKGGGLARASRAKHNISCIISDVLGDPIEFIASGPTLMCPAPDPAQAIEVLDRLVPGSYADIRSTINNRMRPSRVAKIQEAERFTHIVMANNATAVDAAGTKAVELGYRYWMTSERKSEGDVNAFGERFASQMKLIFAGNDMDCIISGGEPTVILPETENRGNGGRNQQLALRVLEQFCQLDGSWPNGSAGGMELAFVSGGTDGEDGPTDAAGAFVDSTVFDRMKHIGLDPVAFLKRCDAYAFFQQTGGLLMTGPTGTNVCDLRVAVVDKNIPPQQ